MSDTQIYETTTPCSNNNLGNDKSEINVTKSESYQDDSKPPPMAIAASTSETEDDEDLEENKINTTGQSTNPFAPREGKTLYWRNVVMSLVCFILIRSMFVVFT